MPSNFTYNNEHHAREDLIRFSNMNRFEGRPLILVELQLDAGPGWQIVTEMLLGKPLMIALNGVTYT